MEKARFIYEMDRLQDPQKGRYATYEVNVANLKNFQEMVKKENIHYIHE